MREILFRGKRLDNGEWVEGDLVQICDGRRFIVNNRHGACIDDKGNFINTESPFVCKVAPATVGQYTGLMDKNGKRIFEGDVVQFQRVNALGWFTQRVGEVLFPFDDETPCFYVYATTGDAWDFYTIENIVVIGNTHDNPELLKDGEG